jgi:hypothetical protein
MRLRIALTVTVVFLMPVAAHPQVNRAEHLPSMRADVDAISAALDRGEVKRVEILRVPADLETRAAINPKTLERIYYTKLVIRNITEMPFTDKMIEAFRGTSIEPRDYIADLRWGVVFYSREEVRLGAIYFDRSGRYGAVNEAGASFKGSFFTWLESTFSSCP